MFEEQANRLESPLRANPRDSQNLRHQQQIHAVHPAENSKRNYKPIEWEREGGAARATTYDRDIGIKYCGVH